MEANPQPGRSNRLASILFWFWGVFLLLSGFAVGYPALMVRGALGPLLFLCTWGLACCVAGFALRRGRWGVRWWGSALCVVSSVLLLLLHSPASLVGVAL